MTTVREIYDYLDKLAPTRLQAGFDNAGFLVGVESASVNRVIVSLDVTREVVREAVSCGAQLIVSHHPVIFHPIKRVVDTDPVGSVIIDLISGGVSAICMHTNLDAVQGGVNDCLARALGLTDIGQLKQDGVDDGGAPYGIGRTGRVFGGEAAFSEFAAQVKRALGCDGLRYYDAGRPVRFVAVVGGSGGDMLSDAQALGCDTFVTADLRYDAFLQASARGINLIDAGHYPTEDVVTSELTGWLKEGFPDVDVNRTAVHHQTIRFL